MAMWWARHRALRREQRRLKKVEKMRNRRRMRKVPLTSLSPKRRKKRRERQPLKRRKASPRREQKGTRSKRTLSRGRRSLVRRSLRPPCSPSCCPRNPGPEPTFQGSPHKPHSVRGGALGSQCLRASRVIAPPLCSPRADSLPRLFNKKVNVKTTCNLPGCTPGPLLYSHYLLLTDRS